MTYFLLITHPDGTKDRIPVGKDGITVVVNPGDDVQLIDGDGFPVTASLLPDGDDLTLLPEDGREIRLKHFYQGGGEQEEPITVTLDPADINEAEYEFNSQVGNLPDFDGFTLMRFSNTGYLDFEDQIKGLNRDDLLSGLENPQGGSGGGGGGSEDQTPVSPPRATDDFLGTIDESGTVALDILGNDQSSNGGISLHRIEGRPVVLGKPITLASGATVTLQPNGKVEYDTGESFIHLDDAEFDFVDLLDGEDDGQDMEIITDSGEVVNLDNESGLDTAPGAPAESGFDEIAEGGVGGASMDDEAAQAAAENGG